MHECINIIRQGDYYSLTNYSGSLVNKKIVKKLNN